ncbi:uncharacterized protein LOC133814734 [Humulus lupulus]|uniref:uncharacterized protein LOC133814734 n=1 Tax=Humulus lupulus TaxID=3486 RepID=UPI002B4074F8|nr:uncharacterized protein LOC133814734 [Humulus lupulus]
MRVAAGAKTVGDEGKMMALTVGVRRHSPLWNSLRKNGVKSTQEFLDRADQYIKLEECRRFPFLEAGSLSAGDVEDKEKGIKILKEDWGKLHIHIASYKKFPTAIGLASSTAGLACFADEVKTFLVGCLQEKMQDTWCASNLSQETLTFVCILQEMVRC